jgi:hypothetical protein
MSGFSVNTRHPRSKHSAGFGWGGSDQLKSDGYKRYTCGTKYSVARHVCKWVLRNAAGLGTPSVPNAIAHFHSTSCTRK